MLLLVLQSSILIANISETDLASFADALMQSLHATPPTSGDLFLIRDLLNRSVSVFENVHSRKVANNISQVLFLHVIIVVHFTKCVLHCRILCHH